MPESEREPFQLGIFMPNCSHAYCISSYKPEPDDWTYESNKNIAQAAETFCFRSAAGAGLAARPIIWAPHSKP